MAEVWILNGPNLNLLGEREPEIYGRATLVEILREAERVGAELGVRVQSFQSNHEGELIEWLHQARGKADGIVLNAGGLTHTSIALRDAVAATGLPAVEVHLTNLARREPFRRRSLIAEVAWGSITRLGPAGNPLAVRALWHYFQAQAHPGASPSSSG
jgi:3-dehydroquinate dehydratase II